jgi:hypothetical protein
MMIFSARRRLNSLRVGGGCGRNASATTLPLSRRRISRYLSELRRLNSLQAGGCGRNASVASFTPLAEERKPLFIGMPAPPEFFASMGIVEIS